MTTLGAPWPEFLAVWFSVTTLGIVTFLGLSQLTLSHRPATDLLILGERGLAEWRDGSATVLLWPDLGVSWHPLPLEFDEPLYRGDIAQLLLEHDNGTRVRLSTGFAGIAEVRALAGEHLQRNLIARADSPLPDNEPPLKPPEEPEEPWPALTPGPWVDSEAAQAIGPVLAACPLTPKAAALLRQRADRARAIVILVTGPGFLLATGALLAGLAGRTIHWPALITLLVFGGGGVLLAWLSWLARRKHLQSFLLLGERGIASWDPYGAKVILWEDLGIDWRASVEVRPSDRGHEPFTILLKLQHADGDRFHITDRYENAARVVTRVRRELRRMREPARKALAARLQNPDAIQRPLGIRVPTTTETPAEPVTPPASGTVPVPEPWGHSRAVRDIGPIEIVCRCQLSLSILELLPGLIAAGATIATLYNWLFGVGFYGFRLIPDGLALALWLFVGGVRVLRRQLAEEKAWLVGANGLAFCTETQATTIHWDDIGTVWRPIFLDEELQDVTSVPLVFIRGDGTQLWVTREFRDVDRLLTRVREELTRRLGPDTRLLRVRSPSEGLR
jgi:hypothetical protein